MLFRKHSSFKENWKKITTAFNPYHWLAWIVFLSSLMVSFNSKKEAITPHKKVTLLERNDTSGRELAKKHCASCHLFPDPSLLDKKTWTDHVLPNMALRLGLASAGPDPYDGLPEKEAEAIKALNIYPSEPQISLDDWGKIVAFYKQTAPNEPLPQIQQQAVTDHLTYFKTQTLNLGDITIPKTSLLKFDSIRSELYVGDDQHALFVLQNDLKLKQSWWIDSAPTDIDFPNNAAPRLLTIGTFSPSEQKLGRLSTLEKVKSAHSINIANLARPVQFEAGDLNEDGLEDILICEFGNHSGKLSWFDHADAYKEHIISSLPGYRKAIIQDMNGDNKPDIIALRAQAWEGISVFYNHGKGDFLEKNLLQFPPSFGASYFELADFNADGLPDILLTNGDNWDYSPIHKNYHGVRIYLNEGENTFKKEAYFYPLYGVSKALARDFDMNGTMDIAIVSFYSDLADPSQGFTLLNGKGNLDFQAHTTAEAAYGKWLTMEAGDFDGDGDIDLVLGSYFQSLGEITQLAFRGILEYPQLLVLTNTTR